MRFKIRHLTHYTFSAPVALEPHDLRLNPRLDGAHRCLAHELLVTPAPGMRTEMLDEEGNHVTRVWFHEPVEELRIEAKLSVQTLRVNSFDFVLDANAERIFDASRGPQSALLAPYRLRTGGSDAVQRLARDIAAGVDDRTIPFLTALAERLRRTVRYELRESGYPFTPEECLARGSGSCRDQAVLFVDACRALGLAARFVSGYHPVPEPGPYYLHAWAEVFLPGGGWRGFDPTGGLAVADRHVPLAAARYPSGAAPVTGSLRGDAVQTELKTELDWTTEP
ncbi:MAG: hypothetical protein AMXMBFR7_00890 [Planctomycetota bacterium]